MVRGDKEGGMNVLNPFSDRRAIDKAVLRALWWLGG